MNRHKLRNILILICFLLIFFNTSKVKAESNQLVIFEWNLLYIGRSDVFVNINYKTTWENTTISLKDNNTQLFLKDSNKTISFSEEGNSTWEFEEIVGVHYISAYIYNDDTLQFTYNFGFYLFPTITNGDWTTSSFTYVPSENNTWIWFVVGFIVFMIIAFIVYIVIQKIRKREDS